MLDNKLKDQLKAYLRMLKSNVTIGLSLNEDENSKKLKEVYDKNYIYTIIQCLQNELKRNTSSNFEVIKAIKDILHDKEIVKNINNLENVKWKNKKTKILYKLIKYKQSVLLYFYCIKKMNS